jgi:ABC-type dipeptide/oligopeptide/nickel transport system permease component
MFRYILKRLLMMIPVVLGVTVLIFTVMYFTPGDPAQTILGPNASFEQIEAKREELGLNQPYLTRLLNYLNSVFLHGDLGTSYTNGRSVSADILSRFPRTAIIAFVSVLLSLIIGIPIGVVSAVHQNTWHDRLGMLVSLVGVSMPAFWVGLLLVIEFSLKLRWLPSSGIATPLHYIMPCFACSLGGIATMARQTRSSMLEVIRSDYIVTARAKGQTEFKVIYWHALKNALIPIITVAGTSFGIMLGGALVIETVFSIPGLGLYMVKGINNRDYPALQGAVIFLSIVFSLVMLLTDLVYAYVDPRIKGQYQNQKRLRIRKG